MKRAFSKYLLILSILLVGGSSNLYAHTYGAFYFNSPTTTFESTGSNFSAIHGSHNLSIGTVSYNTPARTYRLGFLPFEIEEEDKLTSSKRHFDRNNCSASLLLAQSIGHFFVINKDIFHFFKYLSLTYSNRYLKFSVLRL